MAFLSNIHKQETFTQGTWHARKATLNAQSVTDCKRQTSGVESHLQSVSGQSRQLSCLQNSRPFKSKSLILGNNIFLNTQKCTLFSVGDIFLMHALKINIMVHFSNYWQC